MPCKNLPSSKFLNFSEIYLFFVFLITYFLTVFLSGRNISGQFHTKENIGGKVFAAQ